MLGFVKRVQLLALMYEWPVKGVALGRRHNPHLERGNSQSTRCAIFVLFSAIVSVRTDTFAQSGRTINKDAKLIYRSSLVSSPFFNDNNIAVCVKTKLAAAWWQVSQSMQS